MMKSLLSPLLAVLIVAPGVSSTSNAAVVVHVESRSSHSHHHYDRHSRHHRRAHKVYHRAHWERHHGHRVFVPARVVTVYY